MWEAVGLRMFFEHNIPVLPLPAEAFTLRRFYQLVAYSRSKRTPFLAENGQGFLRKTDTHSCRKRTGIPDQSGQGFLRKTDSRTPVENGQ
ncbi:MAG TPA: hypothetical protein VE912_04945 [Bacteroidales bacterium]|nr:hypothetical protein [Bacteroidales bacterium]